MGVAEVGIAGVVITVAAAHQGILEGFLGNVLYFLKFS